MVSEIGNAYEWKGRELIGSGEERIGKIEELWLDEESGRADWATVHTGLFGTKTHFVPLATATSHGDHIHVGLTKEQIESAPTIESTGRLSEEDQTRLFEHYGVSRIRLRRDADMGARA